MVELLGAIESTYLPAYDLDITEINGHSARWRDDLRLLAALGIRRVRLPVRWHRVETVPGVYDFTHTDEVMRRVRELGMSPIVDFVHHTSYPRWLDDGFADPRFGPAYLRWCGEVARRYPWLREYTLFNEPFATLFLAGHQALWPPYGRGVDGFVRLLDNVVPPLVEATQMVAELLPAASHVWVDTCEDHRGTAGEPGAYAELCNDRRTIVLDLVLGHDLDVDRRPFLQTLVGHGGDRLVRRVATTAPGRIDVLGLDYYPHSEWWYDAAGGHAPSPSPRGFAALSADYGARYGRPLVLSETNIRGFPSDRSTWLRLMLEQYETAVAAGVDLRGFCWFPTIDSSDWDSLLARAAGRVDPVGLVSVASDGSRNLTLASAAAQLVAGGATSAQLPAYQFAAPASGLLAGHVRLARPCRWENPPPDHEPPSAMHVRARSASPRQEPTMTFDPIHAADLVVLSHLRWPWVWQRPQHLISRLAPRRAAAGARTWFVEEPVATPTVTEPVLRHERRGDVGRVWLEVPGDHASLPFDAPGTERYAGLLRTALGDGVRDVWLYSPMALDIAVALDPRLVVFDVMDDLASFSQAPEGLVLRHRRALAEADVVFTGGRSLHHGVTAARNHDVHLFPSGVEAHHWRTARELREARPNRDVLVAGYVGVVDERLDLGLLADLAEALASWEIHVVGPVAKIDPAHLPRSPNLVYHGQVPYEQLPQVLAEFDVALMPFAINEATRSISPTKTLEYLAAGLPVVSTKVPDVVADHEGVVHLVDTAEQVAAACRHVVGHSQATRDRLAAPLQARQEWDFIANRMDAIIRDAALRLAEPADGAVAGEVS